LVRARRTRVRENIEGYLFILPWLLGFFIWTAGPMVASAVISLLRWEIITPPSFVFLGNYGKLVQDPLFAKSLYNTAYYTFLAVALHVVGAFALAVALNVKLPGINIYRTIYYLPSVTPAVASSFLWLWVFNPNYGLLNALIDLLGLPWRPMWIFDPKLSKPSFVFMSMWGLGGPMVIFLAGLQGIPDDLYEAASIDGANAWRRFWSVTVPMMSPIIFFNLIMQIIGSFQVFTAAYIMTGGGPSNSTLFYVLYLYRNAFEYFKMGYASALAWVLFVVILVFTLLQFTVAGRWVYYEAEIRR